MGSRRFHARCPTRTVGRCGLLWPSRTCPRTLAERSFSHLLLAPHAQSSSTNRSRPSLSLLMVTCSSSDVHRRRRLGREDHRCCPYRLLSQPSSVVLPSLLLLLRTTQCPIHSSFPSNQ